MTKKNDTTFLQAVSAEQGALTLRNNVRVCHSFSSVTAQLQLWGRRQAPFISGREAEGAWRGEGSSHRAFFFFFFKHCHMSFLHLVLQSPFSPPRFLETWCALRAPHVPTHPNMMCKWYRTTESLMRCLKKRKTWQTSSSSQRSGQLILALSCCI